MCETRASTKPFVVPAKILKERLILAHAPRSHSCSMCKYSFLLNRKNYQLKIAASQLTLRLMCIIFFKKVLRESGLRLIYSEADVDFLVPSPGGRVRAKQSS